MWRTTRAGVRPMVMRVPTGGPDLAAHRGARQRHVDHQAREGRAGRQRDDRARIARHHAGVAAVFRQAELAAVGKPGQRLGQLLAAARRRRDGHGEAVLEHPGDAALDPADLVDIGDDALALARQHRRDQGHAARRHVDGLAGIFLLVLQHETAQQRDLHALVASSFADVRPECLCCVSHGPALEDGGNDSSMRHHVSV